MPFLLIYSSSDFVTPPPIEAELGQAAGSPPFSLTLRPGATGTLVEVNDDDLIFDELDPDQVLTNDLNLDGVSFRAGTTITSAYDLLDSTTGNQVTSLHISAGGGRQGPVDGIVANFELIPGVTYTFDSERTSNLQDNPYLDFAACFCAGTLIATPHGPRAIETLRQGDLITTRDNGAQPLRWLGRSPMSGLGKTAPVRIAKGALGNSRDLFVSPEHRMLHRSAQATLITGADEVLVAAKFLVNNDDIVSQPRTNIVYFHLLFDAHEIIYAEGCATESLLVGPQSIGAMSPEARAELDMIFPDLDTIWDSIPIARPCLRHFEAALLS